MNLIIYETRDSINEHFYRTLSSALKKNTILLSTDQIATNTLFSFSLSNQNSGFIFENKEIKLNSREVTNTINCVSYLDMTKYLSCFQTIDRSYIQQEWHSIFITMLYSLKNSLVFNTILPLEFTDRHLSKVELNLLFQKVGLNYFSSDKQLFTQKKITLWNEQSFGNDENVIPRKIMKQLIHFCDETSVKFCQFSLFKSSDNWVVSEVKFQPSVEYFTRTYISSLIDYLNR